MGTKTEGWEEGEWLIIDGSNYDGNVLQGDQLKTETLRVLAVMDKKKEIEGILISRSLTPEQIQIVAHAIVEWSI